MIDPSEEWADANFVAVGQRLRFSQYHQTAVESCRVGRAEVEETKALVDFFNAGMQARYIGMIQQQITAYVAPDLQSFSHQSRRIEAAIFPNDDECTLLHFCGQWSVVSGQLFARRRYASRHQVCN